MKTMFEAAQDGYFSAFVNNIHPPRYNGGPGRKDQITPVWPHEVWKYCRAQGIPSWSGEMLLDFAEARHAAHFEHLAWHTDASSGEGRMSLQFLAPQPGQDLTIMIPAQWSGRVLQSISVDGRPEELKMERIKGVDYAMFTIRQSRASIEAGYQTR